MVARVLFGVALEVEGEVPEDPVEEGEALGDVRVGVGLRLDADVLGDPEHVGHVFEGLLVDVSQPR